MMNPRLRLLLLFLFAGIFTLQAQVTDKIKSQSDQNSHSSTNSDNHSSGSSSSGNTDEDDEGGCLSGLFNGCLSGCANACFSNIIPSFITAQEEALNKSDSIPRIISIELLPQAGVHPDFIRDEQPYNYFIPRLRLNWGIFSTDFRMHALYEKDSVQKNFITYDWQILSFNIVNEAQWRLSLGGGMAKEQYSKTWFPELSMNTDIFLPANQRWKISSETRFMYDLVHDSQPRWEWSVNGGYALINSDDFHLYFTFGAVDDLYYSVVNTWGITGGLYFRID